MRNLRRFDWFCGVAETFWDLNLPSAGERVILVEALSQDLRVSLRNLTIANALRRIEPARVVVFSGTDEDWNEVVWTYFELDELTRLAEAYGASQVFDVHALVDARVKGEPTRLEVGGVSLDGELAEHAVPQVRFDRIVTATTCRMRKVARLDEQPDTLAARSRVERRSTEFARVFEALFTELDVVALVTSHVDYNVFGFPVETALSHDVPVVFTQSTGGLKAYTMYPEDHDPEWIRAGLTTRIGRFFDEYVWPQRDLLRRSAELATFRGKIGLGLPAWWGANTSIARVDLQDADERMEVRVHAARRVGLDPDKPTVCVFNHAVSDALWTNVEAFPDLVGWFEATVDFALSHPEVNWLFLEHPQQGLYDDFDTFGGIARRHPDEPHMVFMNSSDLSKNFVVSLSDLVLTVRGSVATEYPVYGIPAIQAGWSDWSSWGFTTVASTPEEYFAALTDHLARLKAGEPCVTDEQVERARLWTWFYRAAADVSTPLVPHWRMGQSTQLFDLLTTTMAQVEPDGDPLFAAVRRMWVRREPMLTRFDWAPDDLSEVLVPMEEA